MHYLIYQQRISVARECVDELTRVVIAIHVYTSERVQWSPSNVDTLGTW